MVWRVFLGKGLGCQKELGQENIRYTRLAIAIWMAVGD